MSTVRAPVRHRPAAVPRTAPVERRPRRHLEVVGRRPPARRRLGRTGAAVAVVVFVGLFALAAFHTVLVQEQIHLDGLEEKVAAEQAEYQQARLEVARLESPQRVVDEARIRLGMVVPDDVVYLTPDSTDRGGGAEGPAEVDDTWLEVKPYLERNP